MKKIDSQAEFQPTSEDIEIKSWELPNWNNSNSNNKKIEVVETVKDIELAQPITVEELEVIRNNAYDEGFLQGLNEGREKGQQEGHELGLLEGKKEGHESGHQQGEQEGRQVGFEAGRAEGLDDGKISIDNASQQLASVLSQLQASVLEQDAALPQVVNQLVKVACENILGYELSQGDRTIFERVEQALEQLPDGEENIMLFISSSDAPYLEDGLARSRRHMAFEIDDQLDAGAARVVTKYSLIEFSTQERMEKVFEHLAQACQTLGESASMVDQGDQLDDEGRDPNAS